MTLTFVNPLQLESGVNVRDLNLITNCRGTVPVEKQNKRTTKMATYSIRKQRARTFFFPNYYINFTTILGLTHEFLNALSWRYSPVTSRVLKGM